MPRSQIGKLALTALLGLVPYFPLLGQEPPGPLSSTITGIVTEGDGTPIAGATVVLQGPQPTETRRTTQANEFGDFVFASLPAGRYGLAVELPGLSAPSDVFVTVSPGEQVRTAVVLSLFAYDVSVDVIASTLDDDEVIDPDATDERRSLTRRQLNQLPLPGEQALEVLPIFPGIVRGQNGLISIGGTLPTDSTYLFNGADLMDTFSGTYRLNVPLEAVSTVDMRTGVYGAQYGEQLGGLVNLRTAPGGEEWRTEVASVFPRPWLRSGTVRGIRRFMPRLRFSGPLVPGQLYFSQALEYRFDRDRVEDVPGDRGNHVRIEGVESVTQVDWRAGDNHTIRGVVLALPEARNFFGLNGLTPREATSRDQRNLLGVVLEHEGRLTDRSFVTTRFQYNRNTSTSSPETRFSRRPYEIFPDHYDGVDFHAHDRDSRTLQLRSVYTRAIGSAKARHLVEGGVEVRRLTTSGSITQGPVEIFSNEGTLLRTIDFSAPSAIRGDKWEVAVFAQDRWKPSDRFWLDFGLRVSRDMAADDVRVAPRLGAAFDLSGTGRTLLKVGIGVFYRRIFLGEHVWEQIPTRIETVPTADGGRDVTVLPMRRSGEIDSPRSRLATLTLSHRFTGRLVAQVRVSDRRSRNQLIFDRIEGTRLHAPAGVEPLSVLPADLHATGGGLVLSSTGESTYRQIEFTANLRVGENDQLFVAYNRSSARGDTNTFSLIAGDSPSPVVFANEQARALTDTPNRVIAWGTFSLPADIEVSPALEWRDGFPWTPLTEAWLRAAPANSERFPTFLRADLTFTKGARIGGIPTRIGLQFRNLTNSANPLDVVAVNTSPEFGTFRNSIGLGVRLRFTSAF